MWKIILLTKPLVTLFKKLRTNLRGAAVAQWIRWCLPSCRPGFDSQAHHLCFFQFKL